jgi:hypothetical protein
MLSRVLYWFWKQAFFKHVLVVDCHTIVDGIKSSFSSLDQDSNAKFDDSKITLCRTKALELVTNFFL